MYIHGYGIYNINVKVLVKRKSTLTENFKKHSGYIIQPLVFFLARWWYFSEIPQQEKYL
jgi:hypothetical protein